MRQGNLLCWVYATESDTRKEEFSPPENSPLYTGKTNEVYIEAVDDERFGVCFGIPTRSVREYGADSVCIELSIDKGATSLALVLKARDQASICEKIDCFTCLKEGDWQECGFSFRKIDLDEDLILSHDEARGEIKSFGIIKATIFRGHSYERRDKNSGVIPSSNRRLDQHVSSKRVVKDNGVTHSVNTPVLRSLKGRRGVPLKFSHLPYPNDHIATFVFKYRSQMSLELKKIIGDERAGRLGGDIIATTSLQQDIQRGLKQEAEEQDMIMIAPANTPRQLKRGSVDLQNFELLNMTDTSNPNKRRKSVPNSFEMPIKLEPLS